MNYEAFNCHIFQFYTLRNSTSFCDLGITTEDVEKICSIQDIQAFAELKQSWNDLLRIEKEIPQYFGLLAIQCLAATLMEADDDITHRDYNVRLSQLLGLTEKHTLQALYVGDGTGTPIQEQIWQSAVEFLRLGFGLEIQIPAPTSHAGRFVQFPKSQALLTKEDLKRCTEFYFAHFLKGETVHFSFFKQKFLSNMTAIPLPTRARKIIENLEKEDNALRQLFNHFNHWDGKVWEAATKTQFGEKQLRIRTVAAFEDLMLNFESETPAFYLLANSRNVLQKVNSWDPKTRAMIPDSFREIAFFQESSLSDDEFHASRYLVQGEKRYVLVAKTAKMAEYRFLLRHCLREWEIADDISLFETALLADNVSILRRYIENPASARLWGGIKTGKDNTYVAGFGPEISAVGDYVIISNGWKIPYSPSTVIPGSYVVRSSENRDLGFNIVELPEPSIIAPTGCGWNLRYLTPGSSSPSLEGCRINIPTSSSKIAQWRHEQQKVKPEYSNIVKLLFS